MRTECQWCRRTMQLPDEMLGQEGGCPWCGKLFIIKPAPIGAPTVAAAEALESLARQQQELERQKNLDCGGDAVVIDDEVEPVEEEIEVTASDAYPIAPDAGGDALSLLAAAVDDREASRRREWAKRRAALNRRLQRLLDIHRWT